MATHRPPLRACGPAHPPHLHWNSASFPITAQKNVSSVATHEQRQRVCTGNPCFGHVPTGNCCHESVIVGRQCSGGLGLLVYEHRELRKRYVSSPVPSTLRALEGSGLHSPTDVRKPHRSCRVSEAVKSHQGESTRNTFFLSVDSGGAILHQRVRNRINKRDMKRRSYRNASWIARYKKRCTQGTSRVEI